MAREKCLPLLSLLFFIVDKVYRTIFAFFTFFSYEKLYSSAIQHAAFFCYWTWNLFSISWSSRSEFNTSGPDTLSRIADVTCSVRYCHARDAAINLSLPRIYCHLIPPSTVRLMIRSLYDNPQGVLDHPEDHTASQQPTMKMMTNVPEALQKKDKFFLTQPPILFHTSKIFVLTFFYFISNWNKWIKIKCDTLMDWVTIW